MKKLFLLLAGVSLLTACEREPNVAPKVEEESQLSALDRYLTRVAEEGIAMLGDTPTRAGARRVIDPARTRAFVKATTRSEEDTLFYVVNFADSTGFALVEADTTSPTPLIAVTEQGNYTPGEVTNTGFDDYIELLSQNSTRSAIMLPEDTTTLRRMYSELEEGPETIVEPLLEVEWGQHEPYNYHCYNSDGNGTSRGVAGCAPVAIAQILSYHEYPLTLELTHPYADSLGTITLDWDQLKTHTKTIEDTPCSCTDDHFTLPHLLRQIGQLAGTSYFLDVGSTNKSNIPPVFQALGYTVGEYVTFSQEATFAELDASRPILCKGNNAADPSSGHAWVIDGYHYQYRIMRTYQEGVGNRLPTLISEEDWSYNWLHVNWGWDGNYNGYYKTGVFYIEECDPPKVYNDNLEILTNVQPNVIIIEDL